MKQPREQHDSDTDFRASSGEESGDEPEHNQVDPSEVRNGQTKSPQNKKPKDGKPTLLARIPLKDQQRLRAILQKYCPPAKNASPPKKIVRQSPAKKKAAVQSKPLKQTRRSVASPRKPTIGKTPTKVTAPPDSESKPSTTAPVSKTIGVVKMADVQLKKDSIEVPADSSNVIIIDDSSEDEKTAERKSKHEPEQTLPTPSPIATPASMSF